VTTARTPLFLLEIGCEEIPDGSIGPALEFLTREIGALVEKEALGRLECDPPLLGTPRRLAIRARGIRVRQEDRESEVPGPRVAAAYGPDGSPTRALLGFARAQKVTVEDLIRRSSPKGDFVAARVRTPGRSAGEILAESLPSLISRIPFAKTMRWGEGSFRFARPIRWVVCLLDETVVPFEVAGAMSARTSRGPRFEGSPEVPIPDAASYVDTLRRASVFVDIFERRERIATSLRGVVANLGGGRSLEEPPGLLDAVCNLVEHPVACAGSFDPGFLELPDPVLATAMIHHQRFFPIRRKDGTLSPEYVAVLNCRDDRAVLERIRRGNEWVLRARLRDADFFWREDLKRTLAERLPGLDRVLFEAALGSYRQKVDRIGTLAAHLAGELRGKGTVLSERALERAARICKSDLSTQMVKEFPELQGMVGSLLARREGEDETVCRALQEQYAAASDAPDRTVFTTPESATLAVADRLDTLAGFFLIDRIPTGSKDPYGLRRAALAAIQAILDQRMSVSMARLIERASELYRAQGVEPRGTGLARLGGFLEERLRYLCQEVHRLRYDAVGAAVAVGSDDLLDAFLRARALHGIRGLPDFEALSLSTRRVRNILAGQQAPPLDPAGCRLDEERDLLRALQEAEERCAAPLASRDYPAALRVMAGIRSPLDRFFDKVLVMDPDPRLRGNRLALLERVSALLRRVGDFAEMVLEGETAQAAGR
jgi:glycyl-tRNA synthetase beta chain